MSVIASAPTNEDSLAFSPFSSVAFGFNTPPDPPIWAPGFIIATRMQGYELELTTATLQPVLRRRSSETDRGDLTQRLANCGDSEGPVRLAPSLEVGSVTESAVIFSPIINYVVDSARLFIVLYCHLRPRDIHMSVDHTVVSV